jgi:hypothetical protein
MKKLVNKKLGIWKKMFLTCTDFITFFSLLYFYWYALYVIYCFCLFLCLSCMWSCWRSKWIQLMSSGTIIVRVIGSWEGIEGLSYIYLTQASWIFSNLEVLLIYIYISNPTCYIQFSHFTFACWILEHAYLFLVIAWV